MSEIRRAIVKSYDAASHKASVQIAGSLAVWLDAIRVATNIPAADVIAGRQCTVLFLDPSNQDEAVIIAVQGALPSGGGGGVTTFLALTDTPSSYAAQALKHARVDAGETALEFIDPPAAGVTDHGALTGLGDDDHTQYGHLSQAETWAALQTFTTGIVISAGGAGIQLGAGQVIKDSGGNTRYTPATVLPHNTFDGSTRFNANVGIRSAPSAAGDMLTVSPTLTLGSWAGIRIAPTLTLSGNTATIEGLAGNASANIPASTSGHQMYGLNYQVTMIAQVGTETVSKAAAIRGRVLALGIGASRDLTITHLQTFYAVAPNLTAAIGATLTIPTFYSYRGDAITLNNADIAVTTAYGYYHGDIVGSSFTNVRLLELGPATPYFRVVGGGSPGALLTNVWMDVGTVGLRQLQVGAANSGGAGFRQVIVPN